MNKNPFSLVNALLKTSGISIVTKNVLKQIKLIAASLSKKKSIILTSIFYQDLDLDPDQDPDQDQDLDPDPDQDPDPDLDQDLDQDQDLDPDLDPDLDHFCFLPLIIFITHYTERFYDAFLYKKFITAKTLGIFKAIFRKFTSFINDFWVF